MGGAYTAVAGDIGGITYNPAASAGVGRGQFVSDYNQLAQRAVDVDNVAIAGGFRSGPFVHGLGIYRTDLSFDFGNFELTSEGLNLDYTDDVYYYNLGLGLTDQIHLGTNLKYFQVANDVQDGYAYGYGLDAGMQVHPGDFMSVGLAVKNITGEKDWDSGTSEDVPLEARLGTRFYLDPDVAVSGDLVYGEDPGLRSINLGGEWWVWREIETPEEVDHRTTYFGRGSPEEEVEYGLVLRAGLERETIGEEDFNFSSGLGAQFGPGQFDYAFRQRSGVDNQHYFGFSLGFGAAENSGNFFGWWNGEPAGEVEAAEPATASQEREVIDEELSFVEEAEEESYDFALFQWLQPETIDFQAEELRDALAADLQESEFSVYEEREGLQQTIVDGELAPEQVEELMQITGRDILLSGQIETNDATLIGRAHLLNSGSHDVIEVEASDLSGLSSELAAQIQQQLGE